MNPWMILLFLIAVRLCSVVFVQTWFVPDEFWQTVEVAHKIVFGYGYLTWEWVHGIRSYIYPALLSSIFSILKCFHIDSVNAVIYGPRILQAVLSGVGDYCFWKWYRSQNSSTGSWAVFTLCTNWFWLYCGSRTLINSFEATLNTIALCLYPWNQNKVEKSSSTFLWFVSLACMIRPTAAIVWSILCMYHFIMSYHKKYIIIKDYLPIGLIVVGGSVLLDSYYHGHFIFTPFEFLRVNVVKGIGIFYGTHPSHWYLTVGIPVVLGSHLVPFLLGIYRILIKERTPKDIILVIVIVWGITVLSFVPHKEFRFLLPLMPMFVYVETKWFSHWSRWTHISLLWLVIIIMCASNYALLGYLGLVHQRGSLDVISKLALKDPNTTKVMFLMPCHSTPLYSHLHSQIQTRFLTCDPDFSENPFYQDEADIFYSDPEKWLMENASENNSTSHIVIFDSLYPRIENFLNKNNYKLNDTLFHTHHSSGRIGKYVQIYTNKGT